MKYLISYIFFGLGLLVQLFDKEDDYFYLMIAFFALSIITTFYIKYRDSKKN